MPYIITRDTKNNETETTMRQCWTGRGWSKDIKDVQIFDDLRMAMAAQIGVNSLLRIEIVPPEYTVWPADIREITDEDVERLASSCEIERPSRLPSDITKKSVMSTRLTPREEQVLLLMLKGLTAQDIHRKGCVLALEGRRQPVSTTRVHQIKAKAIKKVRRNMMKGK